MLDLHLRLGPFLLTLELHQPTPADDEDDAALDGVSLTSDAQISYHDEPADLLIGFRAGVS